MVYNFTKADEGKYLLCVYGSLLMYHFIIKVIGQTIVYRSHARIQGMRIDYPWFLDKHEELNPKVKKQTDKYNRMIERQKRWEFYISKTSDFSYSLIECYPLDLVVLGLFKQPSKYLTKKQRQQIKDFESQTNQSQK